MGLRTLMAGMLGQGLTLGLRCEGVGPRELGKG